MQVGSLLAGRERDAVIAGTRDLSVRDAVGLLARNRIGALPILDGDSVVGVFSERDMVYCFGEGGAGEGCLDGPVGAVMTSPAITVDRSTTVLDALALMSRRRIRHLPVVEGDRLAGFISIGDLVKSRLEEIQYEAAQMREYIQMA